MRYARLSLGLVLCLLPAAGAAAADGRDFAGFWRLGEITELGEDVSVTVTLRIHNYLGADVVAANLMLEDSRRPGETLATFVDLVDIQDGGTARASDTVIVPRHEYEQWQQGARPRLRLEFRDAAGTTERRPVELAAILADEEEE